MTDIRYLLTVARRLTMREWGENVAAMGIVAVWMMLATGGM